MAETLPNLKGKLFVGIKYGPGGTNVAVSIAVKTTDGRVFVEAIDCRPIRATNRWIMEFLREASWAKVVIDGQNGQKILADLMRKNHMRKPVLPTVSDIIKANAVYEEAVFDKTIVHRGQPSLADLVANCEHRAIGSHGGFGYKSIHPEREIALMDSMILAQWICGVKTKTQRKKQSRKYGIKARENVFFIFTYTL